MKESRTIELKEDLSNTFLKAVSAFSNYGDGKIYFGIKDDGTVIGMPDPENTKLTIENKINDSISPRPDYSMRTDPATNVIELTVHEGPFKPYLYKAKAYKRSDTSSVEVGHQELVQLMLRGTNQTFDELPAVKQDLHFQTLEEKMKEKIGLSAFSEDVLRTLGFYTADHQFNNAAELLADENTFRGIDAVRFGDNINIILDRQSCENQSVLQMYDTAVALYKQYYQYERIEGLDRKLVEQIPEEAFREAIANAIVHRDWNIPAAIRIEMEPDGISVTSPGGLPEGVSEDDYLNGMVSILRNPILGNCFFRMHYIEQFGTGIRRIMDSYASNHQKPVFHITEHAIQVTLPLLRAKDLSDDEWTVYQLMNEGKAISSSDAARLSGFSSTKTKQILNRLVSNGYLKKAGNARATKYTQR